MLKSFRPQRALLSSLMVAFCPLSSVYAAPSPHAAQEIATQEEIYSQSFVTGDTRIAERLVMDDFIGFEPDGKTSDKAAILADVRSEPRPISLKIAALTVRVYGDTAIALGTEEDTNAGTTTVTHRRWLDSWRKTPHGWRLAASAEMIRQP